MSPKTIWFVMILMGAGLFITAVNADSTAPEQEELYRDMIFRSSPYGALQGRHPVTKEAIGYGQYYRFIRNDKGQVTRIERWFRKAIAKGGYNRFGALASAASVTFDYKNNQMIRRYWDENNKPMANYWGVTEETFMLDALGHKTSLTYKDQSGQRVADSRGVWITQWDVSDDGKTVIEDRFDKDGEPQRLNEFLDFGRIKMFFDEHGLRWQTWKIDSNGNLLNSPKRQVAIVKTFWDVDNFDEKRIAWYDADKKLKNLAPYEKRPGIHGFSSEVYEHDSNGYTVGMIQFDTEGQIVTLPNSGSAFARSIVDAEGFVVDSRFFNEKGKPTVNGNGIARIEVIRDATGRPLELRLYDLNGTLTNGKNDGVAVVKITYKDGKQSVLRLDKDGNQVTPKQKT
ncbi:MAG: hypothetical protein V2I33_14510 [Kangiellaceae bacterium]|jgi:hypothetical protein|nr:hypothetical protein [Kangiellaceae bacterium]